MILLTRFQIKQIAFGCTTAKSYQAVMNSHPMIPMYLIQKSLNKLHILEICSRLFYTNRHNFLNFKKLSKGCQNNNYIFGVSLAGG